jgi:hypothetical protein
VEGSWRICYTGTPLGIVELTGVLSQSAQNSKGIQTLLDVSTSQQDEGLAGKMMGGLITWYRRRRRHRRLSKEVRSALTAHIITSGANPLVIQHENVRIYILGREGGALEGYVTDLRTFRPHKTSKGSKRRGKEGD